MGNEEAPVSPRVLPGFRPLIFASEQHKFVYLQIAKNASSTLRTEFDRPSYGVRQLQPNERLPDGCLHFAVLRDPIDRVLSAYHEVSFRADIHDDYLPDAAFVSMAEGPARFSSYLDEIERGPWDGHVLSQALIIEALRIDEFASVEHLQTDISRILKMCDITDISTLRLLRSGAERIKHGYRKHYVVRSDLTPAFASRIRQLYAEDVELYERQILHRHL
jgi:hypothetical protein